MTEKSYVRCPMTLRPSSLFLERIYLCMLFFLSYSFLSCAKKATSVAKYMNDLLMVCIYIAEVWGLVGRWCKQDQSNCPPARRLPPTESDTKASTYCAYGMYGVSMQLCSTQDWIAFYADASPEEPASSEFSFLVSDPPFSTSLPSSSTFPEASALSVSFIFLVAKFLAVLVAFHFKKW